MQAMTDAATIDAAAAKALPAVTGEPQFPTQEQLTKAKEVLATDWAKAIG
jgi:putative spermidine/putrescine transport system substrate-binding protein